MTEVFHLHKGHAPLLVSIPHDGQQLPSALQSRMTEAGLSLNDTDWHVRRLYQFCRSLGASMLEANYSRYVVDLNRPPDGAALYPGRQETSICPTRSFGDQPLYLGGLAPSAMEIEARIATYWQPYHAALADEMERIRQQHGYSLLFEAHSIRSEVPMLFEGTLPELNVGTNGGVTLPDRASAAFVATLQQSPFSVVVNGRFQGGYSTRHYARADEHMYTCQLEIAQRAYMDETTGEYDCERAERLQETLTGAITALLDALAA